MRKLLSFKIKGVKEYGELKLNLISEGQKTAKDKEVELFDMGGNLFVNKLNYIYGKNASGKTSLLKMIKTVYDLSGSKNNEVNFSFFNSDEKSNLNNKDPISLTSTYLIMNKIYKQHIEFKLTRDDLSDGYSFNVKYLVDKTFVYDVEYKESKVQDLIKLIDTSDNFIELNYIDDKSESLIENDRNNFLINAYINESKNIKSDTEEFNLNLNLDKEREEFKILSTKKVPNNVLGKIFKSDYASKIISVFDPAIEDIFFVTGGFNIKFKNNDETIFETDISNAISTGTERGVYLLNEIRESLLQGRDIFIDEIEANFNHKLVKFMIDLFLDDKTNKNGSRLFATTHFLSTLDTTTRKDTIFITERDIEGKVIIDKLKNIKEIQEDAKRKDNSNSKLVKSIYSKDIEPGLKAAKEFKDIFI